ncbi:MAG TPA: hypothetical protein VF077_09625 [Nitrospiraceae bacterium]
MASLTSYYGRMKHGIGHINPAEAAQLGEDWMIAAATGAGIGLLSAAVGGLDKKVFGMNLPVDGLVSLGLGFAGLQMGGQSGQILKIASIAAGGSAAVRTFEPFFKKGLKVSGDFEELGSGRAGMGYGFGYPEVGYGGMPLVGPGVGFGAGAQDRLVEASKYL